LSIYKKLTERRIWRRIFYERLTEPIHLNVISLFYAVFGSFSRKVEFDLVVRQAYAFGVLGAAQRALTYGIKEISVIEFGVSSGTGLINMSTLAEAAERETGVRINVVGFDSGEGMPAPIDYRDHPDMYVRGDFPMEFEKLRQTLPSRTQLILGDVKVTAPAFLNQIKAPVGFVVFDLDYYSSTKAAMKIFEGAAESCLPLVAIYVDDIYSDLHNSFCGELLAIEEFNAEHSLRKIERFALLENTRIFKRATWLKHIFYLHVLDHPARASENLGRTKVVHSNPFL
jgi:hypothetical protein